jgi:UDP-glucose 4-epimerase
VVHGRPVRIFGDPGNVRDYVHLSDVCDLALRVIQGDQPFSIVNAGTGEGFSVREVLRLVEACSPTPVEIQYDAEPGRKLTDWAVLDIGKARREFQWEPKVTLRSGIAEMMQRWQTPAERDSKTTASGRA